jgi:uncharacterized protein
MKILDNLLKKIANNKEVFFQIKAFPGAKNNSLKQGNSGILEVRISSAPEDNKANRAIIKFLAVQLGLRRYQVEIVKGQSDRFKTIKISR